MAEFLRLPNFQGYKVAVGDLLPLGMPQVLEDKEKKRRKAKEKAAANVPATDIQAEAAVDKDVGKEGPCKKMRVRVGPQVQPVSENVSSPTPLNHAKPLETLANEEHVSPPLLVARMERLQVLGL
ncbi:hypothetical protein Tco_1198549 [Tanacetum coccineum]